MTAKSEKLRCVALIVFAVYLPGHVSGHQRMTNSNANIQYIQADFAVADLGNPGWNKAKAITVTTYWNGADVPKGRRLEVRMLWSASALYVRFEANQKEPLVASENSDVSKKTTQLWDRDVCEIFLAPDKNDPQKYFEFEVAPTGEWLDLAIDLTSGERITDWDYRSGMGAAASIEQSRVLMALRIPFEAFGYKPIQGDVWLGNLFRCVGNEPTRGYLAWCPTMTETPNFHVPESFGRLIFDNQT